MTESSLKLKNAEEKRREIQEKAEEKRRGVKIEAEIKSKGLQHLVDEKISLIYGKEVSKFSRLSASFFIFGFLISITIFVVLWYMSVDEGSLNNFFNSIFCNKKKIDAIPVG